ncbi:MAG TPA: DUF4126 domain-containing protein [Thermoanaerobaculia bacterium]|nr:DUF4126 domain-containing protein [Thermoanaerobaculia bacterium]
MSEIFSYLITATGLGIGAGVNAYATFLVFGFLARFYPALFNGDLAEFFSSTPVLVIVGVLYAVEFVADKIPAVDHAWDVVHTFIRPVAGALIAFASANQEIPRGVVVFAMLIGGGTALGGHVLKAVTRGVSTATTAGSANPLLSVAEDLFVFVQTAIAILLPWIFIGLLLVAALAIPVVLSRRRQRVPQKKSI